MGGGEGERGGGEGKRRRGEDEERGERKGRRMVADDIFPKWIIFIGSMCS